MLSIRIECGMFDGKHIVVTGATSGIGYAVTKDLLAAGARVTAIGRNTSRLNELKSIGRGALMPLPFDLTEFTRYRAIFSEIEAIDGLVYSAGIVENNPLRFFSMEKYQRTVDINQTAPLALVSEFARVGKFADGASIVLLSSILGTNIAMKGTAAYAGTKAALLAYAKVISLELAHKFIRANCVAPGMVETELVANAHQLSAESIRADKDRYPLGKRYAQAGEISSTIRFLLSSDSSFITGQNIVVDGGYCAQ